jgi:hypothetical protein
MDRDTDLDVLDVARIVFGTVDLTVEGHIRFGGYVGFAD